MPPSAAAADTVFASAVQYRQLIAADMPPEATIIFVIAVSARLPMSPSHISDTSGQSAAATADCF